MDNKLKQIERAYPWLYVIPLLLTALLIIFRIYIGPAELLGFDLHDQFVAGQNVLKGINPYSAPYNYPPNDIIFCMGFALFQQMTAVYLVIGLNIIGLVAIAYIICCMIGEKSKLIFATILLIITANPFTLACIFMGQRSLIVCALVFAVWYLRERGRAYEMVAGVLLGIASIKPQFMLLVSLWFLLERRWKMLMVSAVTFGLLLVYPVLTFGLMELGQSWLHAVSTYQDFRYNQVDAPRIISLLNMFYVLGLPAAGVPVSLVLSVVCSLTIALWWFRGAMDPRCVLALLMLLTSLSMYLHDYDMVIVSAIIVPFWFHWPSERLSRNFSVLLALIMIIPARAMDATGAYIGTADLGHWRSFVLVALLLWTLWLSMQTDKCLSRE